MAQFHLMAGLHRVSPNPVVCFGLIVHTHRRQFSSLRIPVYPVHC